MSVNEAGQKIEQEGYAARMMAISRQLFNLVTMRGPLASGAEVILFSQSSTDQRKWPQELRAGAIVASTMSIIENSVYHMECARNDAHLSCFDSIRGDWDRMTEVVLIAISREVERRDKLRCRKKTLREVREVRSRNGYGEESGLEVRIRADCLALREPVLPFDAVVAGPPFLISCGMKMFLARDEGRRFERRCGLENLANELYGESGDFYIRALNSLAEAP